jgi:hypothetical protein
MFVEFLMRIVIVFVVHKQSHIIQLPQYPNLGTLLTDFFSQNENACDNELSEIILLYLVQWEGVGDFVMVVPKSKSETGRDEFNLVGIIFPSLH